MNKRTMSRSELDRFPAQPFGARVALAGLALVVVALAGLPAHAVAPSDMLILFSVDAGSDRELSDPAASGDEGFDPGDVYDARGSVIPPSGGSDGGVDDQALLGYDVWPDAPDTSGATAIPFYGCGSAFPPNCFSGYFDLDGFDAVNIDIAALVDPEAPRDTVILRDSFTGQTCVYPPDYLVVSFDDDNRDSWLTSSAAPVDTTSPGGSRFGTTSGSDEIWAVSLTPATGGPAAYSVVSMSGAASENELHNDLAPNPDKGESDDDDVDALDVLAPDDNCEHLYFSVDHEATAGLQRGIYEFDGLNSTLVIRPNVHLGLPAMTDIDAFEFAWVEADDDLWALALIFSVDQNDPNTPAAMENGFRDPGTVLVSFLDGFSKPLVRLSTDEDIDAISASPISIAGWDEQAEN